MAETVFRAPDSRKRQNSSRWYATPIAIVAVIVGLRLLLHLLTANRYGIFRDELYYYACSRHMAWGYVDMPPLVPAVTWLFTKFLGSSLFVLRLIPALAGTAAVALTGYIAHQLGGKRYAIALSTLAIAVSAVFVINGHLLGTNDFEPLLWMGCASIVIRIIQTGKQKLWLWFGVIAGIGLLNKYSISIFGLGIVAGLVPTSERKALAHKWIWIGGLIAFFIFLPNFLWNVRHDWPFVQLMHNIHQSGRDVELSPVQFFLQQVGMANPFAFPLWMAGLVWLFFSRAGGRYRVLGWAYVRNFRHHRWIAREGLLPRSRVSHVVCCGQCRLRVMARTSAAAAMAEAGIRSCADLTLLGFVADFRACHQRRTLYRLPESDSLHSSDQRAQPRAFPLPQYYSDELGWEPMVAEVARIFHSLPPDVQARTGIKASNYGQAGAIDYFGEKYGLPKAICEHQNYWFWGTHGYTGESMILVDEDDPRHLAEISVARREGRPLRISVRAGELRHLLHSGLEGARWTRYGRMKRIGIDGIRWLISSAWFCDGNGGCYGKGTALSWDGYGMDTAVL